MPDYWLDANSLILPYREMYTFTRVPKFWTFLEQEASKEVIVSSYLVLKEIEDGCSGKEPDELLIWARTQRDILFLPPNDDIQKIVKEINTYVESNKKYAPWHVQRFLSKADPWLIAHAKVLGGRVVTFEKTPAANSTKVKIPDVANKFGVDCLSLWNMLDELKPQF